MNRIYDSHAHRQCESVFFSNAFYFYYRRANDFSSYIKIILYVYS